MIKKFIGIKNTGRFMNYSSAGDVELRRYNLFFAENGRGKTTLCAILRSMQTAAPEYIIERTTLGATGNPEVKILLENKDVAAFDGKAWNKSLPSIEIFDSTFINDNVFIGDYVDFEQKRNLYRVIVGSQGVALAAKVDQLDENIRAKNSDIAIRRAALQQQTPYSIKTIEAFLTIAADLDIDAKILDKTNELAAVKRSNEIKTKDILSKLPLPALPATFKAILKKGIEGIGKNAEQRVAQQIQSHKMHDEGGEWLSQGVGYIQGERCPFCGQGVSGNALVAAYRAFFSEGYRQLQAEIVGLKQDIETAFGAQSLSDIGKTIIRNDAAAEFWKQFSSLQLPPITFATDIKIQVQEFWKAALALVTKKASSPLEEVTPDAAFTEKENLLQQVTAKLSAYNTAIDAANTAIQNKKDKTLALSQTTVETALAQFQAVKHRHTPEVSALCTQYQSALDDKKTLDQQKAAAKTQLDQHAESIIGHYEKRINDLLKGFNAGFSIANVKRSYTGGTASSTYQILINGTPVDLGDSSTPVGTPCFRSALSAGDKNTLAFAFFLAQLEQDDKKAEKIVVFDDPFNSQDRSRRTRTKELIKKCGKECRQILVLSHDPYFLKHLWDSLSSAEGKTLQLSRVGPQNTAIEEWDIEKETQEGYFQDHAALIAYLQEGSKNLRDVAPKIRPVLEGYCRYRFPGQFTDKEWLGDMIAKIRDKGTDHQLFTLLEELESINDYSKKYHHDTNQAKADTEPIDDGELQSYVKRTLNIVGGY
jgi:wobble nucleotide-excising tRNase